MTDIEKKILKFARYYLEHEHYNGNITPELILAIAHVESSLNPLAVRVEPDYRWLYKPHEVKPHDCSYTTEVLLQKTSWGVMQIMGAVAREYGYRGWLTGLLAIEQNIWYAIRHLITLEKRGKLKLGDKYGLDDLISDYNDGNCKSFQNKDYVEKVKGWLVKTQKGG